MWQSAHIRDLLVCGYAACPPTVKLISPELGVKKQSGTQDPHPANGERYALPNGNPGSPSSEQRQLGHLLCLNLRLFQAPDWKLVYIWGKRPQSHLVQGAAPAFPISGSISHSPSGEFSPGINQWFHALLYVQSQEGTMMSLPANKVVSKGQVAGFLRELLQELSVTTIPLLGLITDKTPPGK